MELELELGLAPPNHARRRLASAPPTPGELDLILRCGASERGSCGKRGSAEAAFGPKATLPLFVHEDGDGGGGGGGGDGAAGGDREMSSK